MSRSSTITQLPAEILVSIAAYLPKKTLSRLSQTCKHLAEVLETAVYADLDLQLSRTWFETNGLEQLLASDPSGLRRTSTLTIAFAGLSLDDVYNSKPIDDRERYHPEDNPIHRVVLDISDMGKCSYSRFFKLATLLQLLIQKLPKQSLRCFRWDHVTRISGRTLASILESQGQSLQELAILGPFTFGPELRNVSLPELRVLEISDMPSEADHAFTRMLASTRLRLNRIKLGYEVDEVLAYLFPETYEDVSRTDNTQDFWNSLEGDVQAQQDDLETNEEATDSVIQREAADSAKRALTVVLTALDALHLMAMDAAILLCMTDKQRSVETQTIYSLNQPLVDIANLRSLTLESCKMPEWIDSLCACARVKGPLRLEVFALREERVESTFPTKVSVFLGLFRGLKRLSLLLQGENSTMPVDNLIANHGNTLKSLIIDQRLSVRDTFGLSTHIRDSEDYNKDTLLYSIGHGCPNLEQLGLSDFDPSDNWRHFAATMHECFKGLRSLSFRVLPERTEDPTDIQACDDAHETLVAHFIRVYQKSLPNLTLIGTGSLTYKDIWLGRTKFEDSLGCYLCPRYFFIQRFTNIRGQQQPVLTKIAQGTPTGIDDYSSHTDIFQPYWIV